MEQLSIVSELLNTESEHDPGQDAIGLVVEALSKKLGVKMQKAFEYVAAITASGRRTLKS